MNIRGTVVTRFMRLCSEKDIDDEQRGQVLKVLAMVSDEHLEMCHESFVEGDMTLAIGYDMYGGLVPVILVNSMEKG